MLPSSMDRLMSRSPSVCPLWASRSSLLMPWRAASSHRSGLGPKTLKIPRTSILLMSGPLLLSTPELLRDPVEHNGNDHDAQAGQHAPAHLQAVDALQDFIAQPLDTDHGCDHHHGERHHGRLVDACHDVGHGQWKLHAEQLLGPVRAEGPRGLED